jgi:Protein of unknown function (DUF1573)
MIPLLFLAATVAADPAPLVIDAPSVDLGDLAANKPLVQTFKLKNAGSDPLTITDIAAGCGCFRHRLEASVIPPGESTELTVGINLLTQPEGPSVTRPRLRRSSPASRRFGLRPRCART